MPFLCPLFNEVKLIFQETIFLTKCCCYGYILNGSSTSKELVKGKATLKPGMWCTAVRFFNSFHPNGEHSPHLGFIVFPLLMFSGEMQ